MSYQNFLNDIADKYDLSGDEKETFKYVFDCKIKKHQYVLAQELSISDKELQSRLTIIYDKFKLELKEINSKGKFKALGYWLQKQYEESIQVLQSHTIDWQKVCRRRLAKQKEDRQLRKNATAIGAEVNVYVPLDLLEQKEQTRSKQDKGDSERNQYQERKVVKTYEHDDFLGSLTDRQSKNKHIAIVGEAGAGKTTLLARIADELDKKQKLQIFVSLADLQGRSLEEYIYGNWLSKALGVQTDSINAEQKSDLFQQFQAGEIWLLLDGLDEMRAKSSADALEKINREIREVIGQSRVVLTSRLNVWDAYLNRLSGFDTFRMEDFSPEQVDKFIRDWFVSAEKPESAPILQAKLKEPNRDRIRDMVRHPLRLALLCQAFYRDLNTELPETKAGLYELFVRYFYEWKPNIVDEDLTQDTLREELHLALGKLAIAGIDGDAGFRLSRSLAVKEMGDRLFKLASDVGWLTLIERDEQDQEVYAFYHASFQEYFAALAIDDWDFFLPNNHIDKPAKDHNDKYKEYRVFEPRWKEIIAFWMGRKDRYIEKESFIKVLIEFEDGCKDFYWHRAYFLAATCLIEFKNCKFAEEIIEQIIEWTYTYSYINIEYPYYGHYISSLDNEAHTILITLSQFQVYNKFIIDRLSELLKSSEIDKNSSILIAEILGTIDFGNPNALFYLVQIVKSSKFKKPDLKSYSATCWRAKSSLEQLAVGDLNTISMLTEILQDPLICEDTHSLVLNILKVISVNHIEETDSDSPANFNNITNTLEELQRFLRDEYIQYRKVIPILEELVDIVNKIIVGKEELDSKLLFDDSDIKLLFYKKLVDIINDEIVKNKRLGMKRNANYIDVEYLFYRIFWCKNNRLDEIVWSLGKSAVGNTESVSILVDTLKHEQLDNYTRYRLAECLETIDRGNIEAFSSLMKIILENKHLSNEAVHSLSEIAVSNAEVISILVNTLQNEQLDDNTRYNLAKVLGKIDTGNVTSISTLIELLLKSINDEHPDTSEAELLGEVGAGNSDVINLLLKILRDTKSTDEMCNSVLVGLLNALNGLPDKEIELWKLDVIRSVEAALQKAPVLSDVNWLAAKVLCIVDKGNTTAISALSMLLLNFKSYSCSYRNDDSDDSDGILSLVDIFTNIVAGGSISSWKFAVNKLREGVNHKTYKNIYNNFNCCYESLWHCAQNMSYQDFYDAWHSSTTTIQHLEHQFLDYDAVQQELDRNADHPKILCLVVDISHLENFTDQNLLSKRIWNGLQRQFPDCEFPKVNDIGDLEYELNKLQRNLGKKLAIALYGRSANEAIAQLCQSLAPIQIRPFIGGQTTQELITQINAWLTEM
ncbi:NACHT domain-containing protein [Pseudanabaena sp. ABRG5-3]|uniref:NACHT domain-containing protein n=1 Tax=Pseudanabaena sp. ABRG5-3 TaxID=685565 RepID=UPI000F833909|nr:NACHT domain-containing protein [Pseudanabaena sp. ABRG5-3]